MWVKCMKMCFLELTIRKISDYYLKHETLTYTFTKSFEDKTNQNNNKKIDRRASQLKRRGKKITSYPLVLI